MIKEYFDSREMHFLSQLNRAMITITDLRQKATIAVKNFPKTDPQVIEFIQQVRAVNTMLQAINEMPVIKTAKKLHEFKPWGDLRDHRN